MTCAEAISAWIYLAQDVYSQHNRKHCSGGGFKGTALSQKMYEVAKRRDMGRIMYQPDQDNSTGKCFILAFERGSRDEPYRILSYKSASPRTGPNCTIEEAARISASDWPFLTMATLTIGDQTVNWVSIQDIYFNPVNLVFEEALAVFGEDSTVGCVVSLGAGHPGAQGDESPKTLGGLNFSSLRSFANDHAVNAELVDRTMRRRFKFNQHMYFRFNVSHGIESISVDDWKKKDDLKTYTNRYMFDPMVGMRLEELASTIVRGHPSVIPTRMCHIANMRRDIKKEYQRWGGAEVKVDEKSESLPPPTRGVRPSRILTDGLRSGSMKPQDSSRSPISSIAPYPSDEVITSPPFMVQASGRIWYPGRDAEVTSVKSGTANSRMPSGSAAEVRERDLRFRTGEHYELPGSFVS
jgi:hypothetical protein